jgi:hypothetical protein
MCSIWKDLSQQDIQSIVKVALSAADSASELMVELPIMSYSQFLLHPMKRQKVPPFERLERRYVAWLSV